MGQQSKAGTGTALGVVCMFAVTNTVLILNPVLAYVASDLYPTVDYATITYLSTITTLLVVPASLISGAVTGTKVGYKPMAVLGFLLIAIFGSLPYFNTDFAFVMVTRAIVGIGIGMVQPLGNAAALRLFDGAKSKTVQGIGNAVANALGIIFQVLTTAVVLIDVRYSFLVHALMIIPAVIILACLHEPERAADTGKNQEKVRIPAMAYVICILFALIYVFFYPAFLNVSAIIVGEGIGGAADIALVGSLYTIGGVISGLIYGKVYKATGKLFFPVSLGLWVIAMALFSFGTTIPLMAIGHFLNGIAMFFVWSGSIAWLGERIPEQAIAPASGLFAALFNLASFASSPYLMLVANVTGSSDPRLPLMIGVVAMAIIAVVWIAYTARKQKA